MAAPKGNSNAMINWVGRRYGALTVIGHHGFSETGRRILWCYCDCGKDLLRGKDSLNKHSSCGCQKRNPGNHKKLGWLKPGTEPTIHPTMLDIAWAAGIWEGEGSLSYRANPKGWLQVSATQKDREILDRLRDRFGGGVYQRSNYRQAAFTPGGIAHDRTSFDWTIGGSRARGFLMTIWTFLSRRRKQWILSKFSSFRTC